FSCTPPPAAAAVAPLPPNSSHGLRFHLQSRPSMPRLPPLPLSNGLWLQQPHLAVLSWFPANVQQLVQEIAKVLGLFAAGSIFMCTCGDIMAL
ncbi:unnamed protein product, partial [Urochloa humidicola]